MNLCRLDVLLTLSSLFHFPVILSPSVSVSRPLFTAANSWHLASAEITRKHIVHCTHCMQYCRMQNDVYCRTYTVEVLNTLCVLVSECQLPCRLSVPGPQPVVCPATHHQQLEALQTPPGRTLVQRTIAWQHIHTACAQSQARPLFFFSQALNPPDVLTRFTSPFSVRIFVMSS